MGWSFDVRLADGRETSAPLPAEEDMEAAWDAVAQDIDLFIGRTTEEALLFLPRLEPVAKVTSLPVVGGRAPYWYGQMLTGLVRLRAEGRDLIED